MQPRTGEGDGTRLTHPREARRFVGRVPPPGVCVCHNENCLAPGLQLIAAGGIVPSKLRSFMNNCHWPTRRRFLKRAATVGAAVGLGDLSFLGKLPCVTAQDARLDSSWVRFGPEIEPLVRLLEEPSRKRLLDD